MNMRDTIRRTLAFLLAFTLVFGGVNVGNLSLGGISEVRAEVDKGEELEENLNKIQGHISSPQQ